MDQYELIRTAKRRYGKSIREIQRETGHHRKTIRKVLGGVKPEYRRRKPPANPVMDAVAPIATKWLEQDRTAPPKQRHTARRVWERLREELGFEGAESTVRRWVREWRAERGMGRVEAVIPLDPEMAREAEVDWGTAWVEMAGERRQVKLFVMRARASGKPFVRAYPWERQEMFFDGHARAFEYFQGVYPELVYDNLSCAVKTVLRGRKRVEQERFVALRSHYTFQPRFCGPGLGREKGGVEGLVGFARRNFMVPLPKVEDFEELNDLLLERCVRYDDHRIAGREDDLTVGERHAAERPMLLELPSSPFDNHKAVRVKVDAYQTARVDRNRYSAPRAWVGRHVWAHVGCDTIRLYGGDKLLAEHRRLFSAGKWRLDPLHYLELLERRVGAFEAARPIRQWRSGWPAEYETLLERLRLRHGHSRGTREFVRVLRLHESHSAVEVETAVAEALELRCEGWESIRHLIRRRSDRPMSAEPLPAGLIPGVTDRKAGACDVGRFNELLGGGS